MSSGFAVRSVIRQATVSSSTAIREVFTGLRARVTDGFAQVDRGFAEMRGRLEATATGLDQTQLAAWHLVPMRHCTVLAGTRLVCHDPKCRYLR
jgi:hypothetical protein